MTEDEYDEVEFTDAALDCQNDIADYWQAVKEFFLEWRDQMDPETYEKFRLYLEENGELV
jgi:hypothetical protein